MLAPPSFPAGTGDPPPIPAARLGSADTPVRPLLLWVRTGAARVRLDDGPVLHLGAGDGAWIPADGWAEREIITEPGTVAFPLWPHAGVGARGWSELTRFDVPGGWQDWLIQLFNLQVTPFSGRGYSPEAIEELLRRPGSRSPAPVAAGRKPGPEGVASPGPEGFASPGPEGFDAPAMPRAPGARAVTEELMRDPSLDLTVEQWAARVLSSARTLRRDFLADTGLTFEQWR
ncbi:hypothetical protein ACWEWQ_41065, partial [Streptomyces sp. NPDC003832]